jgi:transposase
VVAETPHRKKGSLMKKIRDYILKDQTVCVGLEDSKKSWKVCVRSGRIIVNRTSMEAEYEVLRNYFRNNFPGCKITVMYEAGFRGFELHDKLVADGWKCVVTPPHTVTQEKCSKKKNDAIDADRLAKNLENGDYKSCHVPERIVREDRQVSRLYGQLQKDITRTCSRIRRTIEYHGLERSFSPGDWGRRQYREAEEALLGKLEIGESLRFSLQMLFKEVRLLRQYQTDVLRKMRELAKSDRYKKSVDLLHTAPGIGKLTSIRLALEWGDVSRFKRKEEFAAFLGLIPSDYSTGDNEHQGHITKQGNRQVRAWLIECAWIAIRYDPVLLEKFNRVAQDSQGKMKYKKMAIVAVARKVAMRLRGILLSGEPYQIGLIECTKA